LIESDTHCRTCGYNLRGLRRDRKCPECGQPNDLAQPLFDVLLSGSAEDRRRWHRGLQLAALCVAVALAARVAYFLLAAPGASAWLVSAYLRVGAVNSVLWIVAVWLVTPDALARRWPWMRGPRLAARSLAFMWPIGYACLIARYAPSVGSPAHGWLIVGDLAGRLGGGLGVMCVAFMLHHAAEEAELDRAASDLNAALWLLWFPTLLAQLFPASIEWFTLVPLGLVLFFWGWLMALLLRGLLALSRHARWGQRHVAELTGRDERVESARRELDRAVERSIRPLPPPPGDVPPGS
jgi:hypothetical protein